jgi:hypothetical protein
MTYYYEIEDGEYESYRRYTIGSLKYFTQEEFELLFVKYKQIEKVYNMWSFINWLIKEYEFFEFPISASLDLFVKGNKRNIL